MGQPEHTIPASRKGASLRDGAAHTADHGRRDFLRNLGMLGTAGFLLNKLPVNAMSMSPLAAALTEGDEERVLVLIRLNGGNDGLNTLVPIHDFGTYQAARPDIYVPRNEVIDLSPSLGLHPQLLPLQSLWNEGEMRVVHNVGYEDQSKSHFRGSDIWATTSDADEIVGSGVLGRYFHDQYPDFLTTPPATPPAIQIGGPGNLLFNNEDNFNYAISTRNPRQLYEIARTGQLYDTSSVPDCTYGDQLKYVRAVANTTFTYAGVLAAAFDAGSNSTEFENDGLGDQLALVARLIRGGLKTRFFVVEIGGFDTHANQVSAHANLMNSVAKNVKAFFKDLERGAIDQRVLAMTMSEFGRRIDQNGSQGTDHGKAAPVMLFGPGLNGNGITGGLPDLQGGRGDLQYEVDFRSVYATVLNNWLCIDPGLVDQVMGRSFSRMQDLGLYCQGTTSTSGYGRSGSIAMKAYLSGGGIVVDYQLPSAATVGIHFFDVAGRKLSSPYQGRQGAGDQSHRFSLSGIGWSAGVYVVSLEVNGRMYSRKIGLFR